MEENNQTETGSAQVVVRDNLVVTHHSIKIADREVRYTATAGTLVLKEEVEQDRNGDEKASDFEKAKAVVFFVAYTREELKPGGAPDHIFVQRWAWIVFGLAAYGAARPAAGVDGRAG